MVFAVLVIAEAGCTHFGPFHGRHDGEMACLALKRLDSRVKELNLTPVQQARYDEFRTNVKEQLLAAKEGRRQFREIARTELAKEVPDIAALNAVMKTKIERGSAALRNDLDLFTAFYATLDEGQKQKVVAGIRKRMAARDACREEMQ
jgi:Spy/CpxP family protein refolding chaperone